MIHPNRPNPNENQENVRRVGPAPDPVPILEPEPIPEPLQNPAPQPGPSRNLKRPYSCKVLNLAKKKFNLEAPNSGDGQEEVDERPDGSEPMNTNPEDAQQSSESMKTDTEDPERPGVSGLKKAKSEENSERSDGPEPMITNSENDKEKSTVQEPMNCNQTIESVTPKPSTSESTPKTSESASGSNDPIPCNSQADSEPSSSSPNDSSDSNQQNSKRLSPRIYPDPREGRDNLRHNIRYYCRKSQAVSVENARPPVAVHARPINARRNDRSNYGAFIFDCPDVPRVGPVRRHGEQAHRERRGELYIHQENQTIPREFRHLGFHLVSDSTVLRFGRAENDNINYIHIGHSFHANDTGVRPDRSNLRVLSLTGYRNITDRSLEHLATAAPHLRHIDFSHSTVTSRGVGLFKAIQPNCEVVYSNFYNGLS